MITVTVNPILFVRVYSDSPSDDQLPRHRAQRRTEAGHPGTVRNGTNGPGRHPLCILSLPVPDGGSPPDPMAQRITGIQLPGAYRAPACPSRST